MPSQPARALWRFGVGALLAAASSGCWVPAETGKQMQGDIRALQEQMQSAQKGLAEQRAQLSEQMERAEAQIKQVNDTLAELNRAARMTDADFGVQLEKLIAEVQELRGQIELTDYRIGQMQARIESEAAAPKVEPDGRSGAQAASAGDKETVQTPERAPKDKKGMLEYARKLAGQGKTSEARGVYREIVRQWPSEAGVTDEALMAIGDSLLGEKKYRDAIAEYVKVAEKFTKGSYADDAYFKIASCSLELGNLEDAQIFFNEVVTKYKKSPLLKDAEKRLGEVQRRLEKEKSKKKK